MTRLIISILFVSLFGTYLNAQEGTHLRDQHLPCVEKEFNVMVHVTVDSTTRRPYLNSVDVNRLMDKVSEFFEPICMSFKSCEVNVIENYTFHELVDEDRIRELRVLFAKPRRINVFILGVIPFAYCGMSTPYGVLEDDGAYIFLETDDCPETLEGQFAHHLGHMFGLQDTYHGNDPEIVDDPQCEMRSDSICDTPTDPFGFYSDSLEVYIDIEPDDIGVGRFVKDCEFILEDLDPNGQYYQPQVGNIMSPYPCKCGFTNGQFEKIVRNYNRSNNKPY